MVPTLTELPVLPERPLIESEFDLDVRLERVAQHVSAEKPPAPSEGCGTGATGCGGCARPPG
jgi:hypothetical protein